jgi:TRAP transporter TAXI family solute receptor
MADPGEEGNPSEIRIDRALADFMHASDSGRIINREQFLNEHPEIEGELRDLLAAADMIELMAGPRLDELIDQSTDRIGIEDQTLPHISALGTGDQLTLPVDMSQPSLPCRFGDYILLRILGRGGMGVVYAAQQKTLQRSVAIKMIRSGCLASDEEVQRFYAEARNAAKLAHPNIVTVYHIDECDGHHFFTMDQIDGTDLARKMTDGTLNPRQSARYVRDVARAIAYAHSRDVLHRDLKPANVLINENDDVVVTDFGLAKVLDAESGLTATGAALGTPSYMPPEQAAGDSENIGKRSDVYSLGAVLFALLAGRPPFRADSPVQTIMQVINLPPPLVRDLAPKVHADLETIVSKCLQKQPLRRYDSADELADELDRYLRGEPIQAKPLSQFQKTVYWVAGIPIVSALVGASGNTTAASHHWAQRILIGLVCLLPFVWFGGPQAMRWWTDTHLPRSVRIAAGSPEGTYFFVASRLAKAMTVEDVKDVAAVATNGSEDNVARLKNGTVQLAMVQADSLRDPAITVVSPLYYETVHVLIRRDRGIQKPEDLRGKKLLAGRVDSGMRQSAIRLLGELSIKPSEVEFATQEWTEKPLADDIDAAIIVIQKGNGYLQGVLSLNMFEILPLTNAIDLSLDEPTFRVTQILQADYPNIVIGSPIPTLATPAFLACRNDASARLVEYTLQTLYESEEPIQGILSAESASHWQSPTMHKRARQYFEKITRDR